MPLTGHCILLVEDEFLIALDLMTVITEAHGEVMRAATLAKAMELADTPGLSLALLDFRLGSEVSLPVSAKLCAAISPRRNARNDAPLDDARTCASGNAGRKAPRPAFRRSRSLRL